MKATPVLVLAGTVAGIIGVLGFHTRPVTAPAQASGGASRSASPVPAPSARGPAVRSALGPEENFGYGVLGVTVTVRASRIINVSVTDLQTAEPTSQQISEQAIA